jgi:hypothetical protein
MIFLFVHNFWRQSFGWFYYTGNTTSEWKCLHVQLIFLFNDWTLHILLERKTIRFCKHILCKIMNFRALHLLGESCATSVTSVVLFSMTIFKNFLWFFYSNVCNCLGHLNSLLPTHTHFQAESVLPLSLIVLNRRHKDNKEDKAFLLLI